MEKAARNFYRKYVENKEESFEVFSESLCDYGQLVASEVASFRSRSPDERQDFFDNLMNLWPLELRKVVAGAASPGYRANVPGGFTGLNCILLLCELVNNVDVYCAMCPRLHTTVAELQHQILPRIVAGFAGKPAEEQVRLIVYTYCLRLLDSVLRKKELGAWVLAAGFLEGPVDCCDSHLYAHRLYKLSSRPSHSAAERKEIFYAITAGVAAVPETI